jgi:hypothetical protein
METTRLHEGDKDTARIRRAAVDDVIRKQVVLSLGRPVDLLAVHVRPVRTECFRVNVVVGKDFASSRIANSFFLTADADGKILASSPKIVGLY